MTATQSAGRALVVVLLVACGGATEPSPTPAEASPTSGDSVDLAPAGPAPPAAPIVTCPPTYAEALRHVGRVSSAPIPEAMGTPELHLDVALAATQAPPSSPDQCPYTEGSCHFVRYESACVAYVDFACGEPTEVETATLEAHLPCDRPARPAGT